MGFSLLKLVALRQSRIVCVTARRAFSGVLLLFGEISTENRISTPVSFNGKLAYARNLTAPCAILKISEPAWFVDMFSVRAKLFRNSESPKFRILYRSSLPSHKIVKLQWAIPFWTLWRTPLENCLGNHPKGVYVILLPLREISTRKRNRYFSFLRRQSHFCANPILRSCFWFVDIFAKICW